MITDSKGIKEYKYLFKNFGYLSLIQLINLLIPVAIYPYLVRVLGKDIFGLVVFAHSIAVFSMIFVSFGFNISATKDISIHRTDKSKLSEIVSSILIIKAFLFAITTLLFSLAIQNFPLLKEYQTLFYLSLWVCVYDILLPVWYYQGIEDMKKLTYLNFLSKIILFVLIFLMIKGPDDYLLYPLINGVGALLAGFVSVYIILFRNGLGLKFQKISTLKYYFYEGLPLFISESAIKVYVSSNKVILGAFVGTTSVAYYDLAEKIISVLKIPQKILSQTIFPKISKEKDLKFVTKIIWLSLIVNLSLMIITILASNYIIRLLGGVEMVSAVQVLIILCISIPFITVSNIYGIQILIPFGHKKVYALVVVLSAIIYVVGILGLWITDEINIINISIISVSVELIGAVIMYIFARKYVYSNADLLTN